jgi:hypothetical protein
MGNNEATSDPATCVAEDLKAPDKIGSLSAANLPGRLGAQLDWTASTESDLGGYNAYWCRQGQSSATCKNATDFTKFNSSVLASPTYMNDTFASAEDNYCFYAEACDKCAENGICPSNAGKENCSGFPTGGAADTQHVKCVFITAQCETATPAYPLGASSTPLPQGKTCSLSWRKNCTNSDGSAFKNCASPESTDLSSYKIMRGPAGAVPTPSQAAPVVVLSAGAGTEYQDAGLINGQQVCYKIYAADSCGNVSQGQGTEVCCTPDRTIPPNNPVMETPMESTELSCSPKWGAVADSDTLTYKVYKCEGDAAACNSAAKFTATEDCTMNTDGLSCTDNTVETGKAYRYCATAVEPRGNESAKYPSGSQPNCGICTPGATQTVETPPPENVTAALTSDGKGVNIYWTLSAGDDHTAGGYNVYRCADATCAVSGRTAVRSCAQLPATSTAIISLSSGSPAVLSPEPVGTWYYGASFQKDCSDATTETQLAAPPAGSSVGGPVTINPQTCDAPGTDCIFLSSCTDYATKTGCDPLREIDTSGGYPEDHTGFPKFAKAGVEVYLIGPSGTVAAGPALTDADGNFKLGIDTTKTTISLADVYRIALKIPASRKSGMPCRNDEFPQAFIGSDCVIPMKINVSLSKGTNIKISLTDIPKPDECRSNCGNINCDDTVDLNDFLEMKRNFSKDVGTGADAANTYDDLNGDGTVDLSDFLILKRNFGVVIDPAPSFVPGLCKQ